METIFLAVYCEEEALQGKAGLSFLHLISWISVNVLDRSHSLLVLKIHHWKKIGGIKGEISIFFSLFWGYFIGLLFGFWFDLFFVKSLQVDVYHHRKV